MFTSVSQEPYSTLLTFSNIVFYPVVWTDRTHCLLRTLAWSCFCVFCILYLVNYSFFFLIDIFLCLSGFLYYYFQSPPLFFVRVSAHLASCLSGCMFSVPSVSQFNISVVVSYCILDTVGLYKMCQCPITVNCMNMYVC